MCRFTRLFWTQCGHSTLSATPEHTQLCKLALDPDEEIRQGFDRAPAFCHPLPEDLEELGTQYRDSDRMVQTVCLHTLCDMCKQSLDVNTEPRGAGREMERPVEVFDVYSDEDRLDLAKWLDLHLSDTAKTEMALQEFAELLRIDREATTAAIASISNDMVRAALLDVNGPQRWIAFRKTHQEAASLLAVAANYMNMQMPRKFVDDLIEYVQSKLYQADLRLDIFNELLQCLGAHAKDPIAYQAAINLHADRLAVRLGHNFIPDADLFAHLTGDMPQHTQDSIATKEHVRRRSIKEHSSRTSTDAYIPRSAFGAGKNKNALTIDIKLAWNPPPQRRWDLPPLRTLDEHVEISYATDLEVRERLSRMGVGSWRKEHVLAQKEVIDNKHMRDDHDDKQDALVGSPNRSAQGVELSEVKENSVSNDATFMGMPLEDSDSEVSDDDTASGQAADGQDASGQELATTDKLMRRGDDHGRSLKRRRCSA